MDRDKLILDRVSSIEAKLESAMVEINKKLDNHIVHIGMDVAALGQDMKWVKELWAQKPAAQEREDLTLARTAQDTDWLKRWFWVQLPLIVGTLATAVLTLLKRGN